MVTTSYGNPLALVTSFKYLRILLLVADEDWPEVVNNLCRARQKLSQLTRVLIREYVDAWTSGQICLAVFQLFMIYG